MNIQSFLKPTIAKISVAVLILIIFVPFINYDTGIRCITTPCPANADGSIAMWLFSYHSYIYSIYYVNLIVGIILSYLISCLIVFIISKIRKR